MDTQKNFKKESREITAVMPGIGKSAKRDKSVKQSPSQKGWGDRGRGKIHRLHVKNMSSALRVSFFRLQEGALREGKRNGALWEVVWRERLICPGFQVWERGKVGAWFQVDSCSA